MHYSYVISTSFAVHGDLVDEKGGHEDIHKFASNADIIVCCLSLNRQTVRMLLCLFHPMSYTSVGNGRIHVSHLQCKKCCWQQSCQQDKHFFSNEKNTSAPKLALKGHKSQFYFNYAKCFA